MKRLMGWLGLISWPKDSPPCKGCGHSKWLHPVGRCSLRTCNCTQYT